MILQKCNTLAALACVVLLAFPTGIHSVPTAAVATVPDPASVAYNSPSNGKHDEHGGQPSPSKNHDMLKECVALCQRHVEIVWPKCKQPGENSDDLMDMSMTREDPCLLAIRMCARGCKAMGMVYNKLGTGDGNNNGREKDLEEWKDWTETDWKAWTESVEDAAISSHDEAQSDVQPL
ncbi:hypothetical protein BC939DRAFT_472908 [Gamsiella multidivaricata]|uniref:uncharacterized protein n=1 Tax=Gamsiella multidivaricata TaxID=101098 RepID=UPI0022211CA8|nr:uncharacterized protein BC939DRAFT_472908 [Gamsiella multidivaricata]KAG0369677.1 hypothetical protein BGZ54_009241 [Gamsiella multidivaricata]KAI7831820.1 hypothetical protein BC939DRAFT_472908 [Gamsiella multidivaricata]